MLRCAIDWTQASPNNPLSWPTLAPAYGIYPDQPEKTAAAKRFVFIAHEKGDANRSAPVEAPFHRIEEGFLTGENFADWQDLNVRARATCDAEGT